MTCIVNKAAADDIIKSKNVNLQFLLEHNHKFYSDKCALIDYNMKMESIRYELTQDEYDLILEVYDEKSLIVQSYHPLW